MTLSSLEASQPKTGAAAPERRILIPDLGIGNMASVANMLRKCGGEPEIVTSPERLDPGVKVLLAGVGSFDAGMSAVASGGWKAAFDIHVSSARAPLLGICLGMQLLCNSSEEGGMPGFGWIDAEVKRFRLPEGSALKVPHMGWNTLRVRKPNPLIEVSDQEQRFYFVHSYHAVCKDPADVLATVYHGYEVTAALSRGKVFGVQFHPEKSHRFGMALLQKFLELPC